MLCPPSAAHPTVPAPERPTATVSPLRTPSSPSRLPAAAIRPHPAVSPQHGHQPPTPGARPLIPLTSAAAAITPPNVSAAHLNGEAGGGPLGVPVTAGPTGKTEERKNEKVRATAPPPSPAFPPPLPAMGLSRRDSVAAQEGGSRFSSSAGLDILISHYFHASFFLPHHPQHCFHVTRSWLGKVEPLMGWICMFLLTRFADLQGCRKILEQALGHQNQMTKSEAICLTRSRWWYQPWVLCHRHSKTLAREQQELLYWSRNICFLEKISLQWRSQKGRRELNTAPWDTGTMHCSFDLLGACSRTDSWVPIPRAPC